MDFKELFIDKSKTLIINTDLAMVLGDLNESIVLNQLNYWLEINKKANKHFIDGRYWVYNTYSDWRINNFPYWSEKTIQRAFSRLESKGIVISANYNKSGIDKTKWYTIDYDALDKIVKEYNSEQDKLSPRQDNKSYRQDKMTCPAGQNDRAIPEITTKTTNNKDYSSENTNKASTNVEVSYKALSRTSGNKVADQLPYEYTQEQFDEFIKDKVSEIVDKSFPDNKEEIESMSNIISYFYEKYLDNMGERHPIMSDAVYLGVVKKLLNPIDAIWRSDERLNVLGYEAMIDRFFKTDYGEKSGNRTDYRIGYFFSDKVIENLFYRELY